MDELFAQCGGAPSGAASRGKRTTSGEPKVTATPHHSSTPASPSAVSTPSAGDTGMGGDPKTDPIFGVLGGDPKTDQFSDFSSSPRKGGLATQTAKVLPAVGGGSARSSQELRDGCSEEELALKCGPCSSVGRELASPKTAESSLSPQYHEVRDGFSHSVERSYQKTARTPSSLADKHLLRRFPNEAKSGKN